MLSAAPGRTAGDLMGERAPKNGQADVQVRGSGRDAGEALVARVREARQFQSWRLFPSTSTGFPTSRNG